MGWRTTRGHDVLVDTECERSVKIVTLSFFLAQSAGRLYERWWNILKFYKSYTEATEGGELIRGLGEE